ncbi:hypothetical protein [Aquirhabdus sp.]|uniref:hypothetical protein n=1 Tax=Aquirhabdus sp. TaxID=2824160 RepID=UPI00396C7F3F
MMKKSKAPNSKLARVSVAGRGICLALMFALTACQAPQPMTADQQLHQGLGFAQSAHIDSAEHFLQSALHGYTEAGDVIGQAKANWALAELYKSKRYQDLQTPPATTEGYQHSAELFQTAAELYESQGRTALAASAHMGAANAQLLANQIAASCVQYRQAESLANLPATRLDVAASAKLDENMKFLADLAIVCAANPL